MQIATRPDMGTLKKRADALTSVIKGLNQQIAQQAAALVLFETKNIFFQVKVLSTDTMAEVTEIIVLASNNLMCDLLSRRLAEDIKAASANRNRFMTEFARIQEQLNISGHQGGK